MLVSATVWRLCSQQRSSTTTSRCWPRAGSPPTRFVTPAMRKRVVVWPDRVWVVEGSNGAGRSLAQRLLAGGDHVVDVPAKLAARARLFDTGHGRKTDAHDAHSVAVAVVRAKELRVLAHDPELEALRMLVDRRAELARQRTRTRFPRVPNSP
jgi:Transposase